MKEVNCSNKIYPKRLKEISNFPQKLYIEGKENLLNSIGIAVVGSRHHSNYGEKMCKKFTQELVQYGITIISGLAEGIDTIAHTTCLEMGGKTIAVLPCGFDHIFPKQNKRLFNNIINLGGTAITEYSPSKSANSNSFLERNRIVAGLAIGTLVVEAGYRSGTSVTARLTMEQGKDVFCIPSSLENRKGITCNNIIQRGGKLVTCIEDILSEFKDIKFVKRQSDRTKKMVNKEYKDIYSILSSEPLHINEIVKLTGLPIKEVNYKLMMLEIDENIIQLPGKEFIKK